MGQRIEGTQRVGQVCFGSVRAARQNRQKYHAACLVILEASICFIVRERKNDLDIIQYCSVEDRL